MSFSGHGWIVGGRSSRVFNVDTIVFQRVRIRDHIPWPGALVIDSMRSKIVQGLK